MKKFFAIVMLLSLLVVFSGCKQDTPPPAKPDCYTQPNAPGCP